MLPGEDTALIAEHAMLFEQFLAREKDARRLNLKLTERSGRALLHGHCHQKAFAAMDAVQGALGLIPGLEVTTVQSSCCGMAGAFGYAADTYEVSMAMGELSLLPAMRKAEPETILVADGFSCRHQIKDGAGRNARHSAEVIADAIPR